VGHALCMASELRGHGHGSLSVVLRGSSGGSRVCSSPGLAAVAAPELLVPGKMQPVHCRNHTGWVWGSRQGQ